MVVGVKNEYFMSDKTMKITIKKQPYKPWWFEKLFL